MVSTIDELSVATNYAILSPSGRHIAFVSKKGLELRQVGKQGFLGFGRSKVLSRKAGLVLRGMTESRLIASGPDGLLAFTFNGKSETFDHVNGSIIHPPMHVHAPSDMVSYYVDHLLKRRNLGTGEVTTINTLEEIDATYRPTSIYSDAETVLLSSPAFLTVWNPDLDDMISARNEGISAFGAGFYIYNRTVEETAVLDIATREIVATWPGVAIHSYSATAGEFRSLSSDGQITVRQPNHWDQSRSYEVGIHGHFGVFADDAQRLVMTNRGTAVTVVEW